MSAGTYRGLKHLSVVRNPKPLSETLVDKPRADSVTVPFKATRLDYFPVIYSSEDRGVDAALKAFEAAESDRLASKFTASTTEAPAEKPQKTQEVAFEDDIELSFLEEAYAQFDGDQDRVADLFQNYLAIGGRLDPATIDEQGRTQAMKIIAFGGPAAVQLFEQVGGMFSSPSIIDENGNSELSLIRECCDDKETEALYFEQIELWRDPEASVDEDVVIYDINGDPLDDDAEEDLIVSGADERVLGADAEYLRFVA